MRTMRNILTKQLVSLILVVLGAAFSFLIGTALFLSFMWDGPPPGRVVAYNLYSWCTSVGIVFSLLLLCNWDDKTKRALAITLVVCGVAIGVTAEWFLIVANRHAGNHPQWQVYLVALIPCFCWIVGGRLHLPAESGEEEPLQEVLLPNEQPEARDLVPDERAVL
jgi:NhaP-type Na+/H+ or K+/H+ antiporter